MEAKARRISGNIQIPVESGRKVTKLSVIWCRWSRIREVHRTNSAKQSLKREQEVLVWAEELEARGSADENARSNNKSRARAYQEDYRRRNLKRNIC